MNVERETYPSVAVIIPTHNRWPHVKVAIESVLNQTYANVECIVVDDCSSDSTFEKIRELYDTVTVVRNSSNKEKSFSRNRGVREANSEYLSFLDSDDILTPTSIEARMQVFADDPHFQGVSFGVTQYAGQSEEEAKQAHSSKWNEEKALLPQYLRRQGFLHTNSFTLTREMMLSHGMFDERLTNLEDIALFIRLLARLPFRTCGTITARMRSLDSSARQNYSKRIRQGLLFTKVLSEDPVVRQSVGDRFDDIRRRDIKGLLSALYYAERYADFAKLYRAARKARLSPNSARYLCRYLVAAGKSIVRRDVRHEVLNLDGLTNDEIDFT